MIGVPITIFAATQLMGYHLRLRSPSARTEAIVAAFAGFIGGFSGVWGPPTVAYLTALNTEKSEQMRVQGVIYGMGAVALTAAHVTSGVLRAETLPFSVAMVIPAVTGLLVGQALHDRIDQQVSAGTVEEWVIANPTTMDHPFHLHVWPMQLIESGGQPVNEPARRDVVNVPAQGQVRVLVDFARHPGRSVYHCHILDHEDAGMMASVEAR